MKPVKTIHRTKDMPAWARWRATDADGSKGYFRARPWPHDDLNNWWAPGLYSHDNPKRTCRTWRSSLRRIVDVPKEDRRLGKIKLPPGADRSQIKTSIKGGAKFYITPEAAALLE